MKKIPPRLHVILARTARFGMVIRRGPSKSVCTIGWDRKTDRFETGQWLRGRIYERRSDLSPDGKHFIYFAMNGRWDSELKGSWTAISKAPYLKAIGLWAKLDRHRVVWVEKGVLYAAGITSGGLGPAKVLYDFGPMEFEAIPAPY